MRKAIGLFWLLFAPPAWADGADEHALIEQRLSTRERILKDQQGQSANRVRAQLLAAYRLQRLRELGFMASPDTRVQDAQASHVAMAGLHRRHIEDRAYASELARVQDELRQAAHASQSRRAMGAEKPETKFMRPVRGVVVGQPEIRRETPTSTEIRRDGVEFLARLDEPVRAVGAGVVRLVEALPQGGFALVVQHPKDWISIVSGLRDVLVRPGEPVEKGQSVGRAGRNLDGAAVVSLELWYQRHPVDPRGLLSATRY